MFQYILTGIVLFLSAIKDKKYQIVSKPMTGIYVLLAVLAHGILRDCPAAGILAGMIPGGICLVFSRASREAFGYGDGMLVLAIGISLGIEPCVQLLVWAFLFSGIRALGMLVLRKMNGKKELAFVPFLLAGFLMVVFAG